MIRQNTKILIALRKKSVKTDAHRNDTASISDLAEVYLADIGQEFQTGQLDGRQFSYDG